MYYKDKKYMLSAKKYHYTSDYKNRKEWCKRCVHFGEQYNNPYWLCSEDCPELAQVSSSGHCDKFSSSKKINLSRYLLLKKEGFQFRNKVR